MARPPYLRFISMGAVFLRVTLCAGKLKGISETKVNSCWGSPHCQILYFLLCFRSYVFPVSWRALFEGIPPFLVGCKGKPTGKPLILREGPGKKTTHPYQAKRKKLILGFPEETNNTTHHIGPPSGFWIVFADAVCFRRARVWGLRGEASDIQKGRWVIRCSIRSKLVIGDRHFGYNLCTFTEKLMFQLTNLANRAPKYPK